MKKMNVKSILVALALFGAATMVKAEVGSPAILFPGFEAPDFQVSTSNTENIQLSKLSGNYVLVQFWASYDSQSAYDNALMWYQLSTADVKNLKMVSVNFDPMESVYQQTVRAFGLEDQKAVRDTAGVYSNLYSTYQLSKGFTNYLIDDKGVIVAQNVSPDKLVSYLAK